MADNSHIEWTDATWQIITGCSIVSPGCTNCYAMKLAGSRLRNHPSRAGLTQETKAGPVWTGEVRFNGQWLDQPIRWKRPRMIFVCAHSDLFHENVPDAWLDQVFAVMALCPQHTFQVLTKRPERMQRYLAPFDRRRADGLGSAVCELGYRGPLESLPWPLPNVWLGTSVEDQRRADERRPPMESVARMGWMTWVSYEPAIGLVEWDGWEFLRWVVSGGESGTGARATSPDWHRAARNFCADHGIPFFFKQWGSWHADSLYYTEVGTGLNPPPSMRIGKKAAGRLLDGVEHNGFPQP